jgi:hypothetical protein
MTEQAMSPLRRRMIEDMTIRKFAPKTQHDYVQRVKNFAAFLGRSPDTASFEDVRRYQLHLAASGVGVPTVNQPRGSGTAARCRARAQIQGGLERGLWRGPARFRSGLAQDRRHRHSGWSSVSSRARAARTAT